jgi:hypothetical protein
MMTAIGVITASPVFFYRLKTIKELTQARRLKSLARHAATASAADIACLCWTTIWAEH